jgi:hypothetical protein
MCVVEYAGADRTTPLVLPGNKMKQGPAMSQPEVEAVDVGVVTAPDQGLITIAVFDSQQLPIVPAFTPRDSASANALLEDTRASIASGVAVATIDARSTTAGDPWAAFAVAIQPPQ